MNAPEFSRMARTRYLPAGAIVLEADESERAALAKRFGVVAVDSLRGELTLEPDKGATLATGAMTADLVQTCAVSQEDFAVRIEEPLALRFVPAAVHAPEEEIELDPEDPDEIPYEGENFDLGEAVAQSLGLAIDPYATGPEAETLRKSGVVSSEEASGPFAALAALKKR